MQNCKDAPQKVELEEMHMPCIRLFCEQFTFHNAHLQVVILDNDRSLS